MCVPEKNVSLFLKMSDLLICILCHDCIVDGPIISGFRACGMIMLLASLLGIAASGLSTLHYEDRVTDF